MIPVPALMRDLPIDPKWNLPIPWFVSWHDGKPQFPVADGKKLVTSVREKLCWCCGRPLKPNLMAFVIGPMCGVNRTSAEPPNHLSCAMYAAQACPFLSKPKMKRMDIDVPGAVDMPGFAIKRNPGACGVWVTSRYTIIDGPLFKLGDPNVVHWYCEGRKATREEIQESVNTGLPILREMAEEEGQRAVQLLDAMVLHFQRYLPNGN
jgi:hypothetical protein